MNRDQLIASNPLEDATALAVSITEERDRRTAQVRATIDSDAVRTRAIVAEAHRSLGPCCSSPEPAMPQLGGKHRARS